MPVVAPGVQVADRDGVHFGTGKLRDRGGQGIGIERRLDPAVGADALAHAEPPVPRHQRLGRRLAEIVAVVLQALAHLQNVAMAFGGQQPDPRALALEQRIGRDRRAVDDALGLGEQCVRADAQSGGEARQTIHDAKRLIGRGGRRLGERHPARGVDRDQIGEGAADVDADPVQRLSAPDRRRPAPLHAPIRVRRRSRGAGRGRAPRRCVRRDRRTRRRPPSGRRARRRAGSRCRPPWS